MAISAVVWLRRLVLMVALLGLGHVHGHTVSIADSRLLSGE